MKKRILIIIGALFTLVFFSCQSGKIKKSEGYVSINGASIYYKTVGSGDPILIIHGGPGLDHSYLFTPLNKLSENHQLIYFDQRACGNSVKNITPSSISLDTMINDIEMLREKFGIEKLNLLAHSFGGILAMKYCIKYPDKIKSLILVSSIGASSEINNSANTAIASRLSAEDNKLRKEIIESDDFKNHKPDAYEKLMLIGFKHTFYNANLIDSLHLQLKNDFFTNSQLLQNLSKDLNNYDFHSQLKVINTPVLLIYGDFDPLSNEVAKQLKNNLSNSKLIIIKNCGHFPFIESPNEFFSAIETFMSN